MYAYVYIYMTVICMYTYIQTYMNFEKWCIDVHKHVKYVKNVKGWTDEQKCISIGMCFVGGSTMVAQRLCATTKGNPQCNVEDEYINPYDM